MMTNKKQKTGKTSIHYKMRPETWYMNDSGELTRNPEDAEPVELTPENERVIVLAVAEECKFHGAEYAGLALAGELLERLSRDKFEAVAIAEREVKFRKELQARIKELEGLLSEQTLAYYPFEDGRGTLEKKNG